MATNQLTNNALSVIALSNEYCRTLEMADTLEPSLFVEKMVKLLPRLYISVTDLPREEADTPDYAFDAVHIDENYYNEVRENIARILGEDDTYLETFLQDMKYSDTPIAATVSESLADIFQVLYDFVEDIKASDEDQRREYLASLREDFVAFWGQTLCNVMRPLNEIVNKETDEEEW